MKTKSGKKDDGIAKWFGPIDTSKLIGQPDGSKPCVRCGYFHPDWKGCEEL